MRSVAVVCGQLRRHVVKHPHDCGLVLFPCGEVSTSNCAEIMVRDGARLTAGLPEIRYQPKENPGAGGWKRNKRLMLNYRLDRDRE